MFVVKTFRRTHLTLTQSIRSFSTWKTREVAALGTHEFRIFYTNTEGQDISPWHDIPLIACEKSGTVNYVNEIPKGTLPKMEIVTKEKMNPIAQDIKKGNLRLFTYGNIPFNYGAVPQTWENPGQEDKRCGFPGDGDPIDVVEISPESLDMAEVVGIKVLGALALIDEEETDWKIIGIRADHQLASQLESEADIDQHLPGVMTTIREWFKNYKTTDGKPVNTFAFEDKMLNSEEAMDLLNEHHQVWQDLTTGKIEQQGMAINTQ